MTNITCYCNSWQIETFPRNMKNITCYPSENSCGMCHFLMIAITYKRVYSIQIEKKITFIAAGRLASLGIMGPN